MKEQATRVGRRDLEHYLRSQLDPQSMADYCPNGLQVEGTEDIGHLVTGVTASEALIQAAIAEQADAILVHHGLFWRGDPQVLHGFRRQRLALLLAHNINVFAFHLPLDLHPRWGNNVALAQRMGWQMLGAIDPKGLVLTGRPGGEEGAASTLSTTVDSLCADLQQQLQGPITRIGRSDQPVRRLAWCTGAAASSIEYAVAAGVDVFVTGELSEPAAHIALETGVALIGAGHHATERGGVQLLGQHIAETFGCKVSFIDCPVDV